MFYPEDILEKVREANDIVDVVGTYVHLTKRGANYVGLCPFHSEKTGSFSVSRSKQIYKCFGCGKSGNVVTFMMEFENLTFPEAVKELAARGGVTLPEVKESAEERKRRNLREQLFEINREAAKYYYVLLRDEQGNHAMEYFKSRALSNETMKNFGLGYSGIYSDGLYKYLKSKGYKDEMLKESGLFAFSERGVCDKFWNRVMFPIMDKFGKVIAFGGRIMGKAENQPKYLNSPETRIFSKGNNLYGMHLAKHSHQDYLLLCEGYMDVIALHQAGFDNAVASLGTALTPAQASLISRSVKNVVITYDSDGAGRNAALRAIPILKEAGITTRVLNMNPYKDPDEFIKALGADEYRRRIDEAKGAFFFETETIRDSLDEKNPDQKTIFQHELAKKLASIKDELERANYIEAAARTYGISLQLLTNKVNEVGREEYINSVAKETVERAARERKNVTSPSEGPVVSRQLFVSFVANNRSYYELIKGRIRPEDLYDPLCSGLLQKIFDLYEAGAEIVQARIINNYESLEEQERVALILDASLYEEKIGENEMQEAFADLSVRVLADSLEVLWQRAVENNNGELLVELTKRKEDLTRLHTELMGKKKTGSAN